MANGLLAQEAQSAAMGGFGGPSGGAGTAGLTQGGGPPPPAPLGGQQPVGAGPQQGQPSQGFPEMCQQVLDIVMRGNPADAAALSQIIIAPLQQLLENRQGQAAPVPGAAPPGVTIP